MELWRHTPQWVLRILIDELPAIEADQIARYAQAATLPHLRDGDRRAQWHELRALARPRGMRYAPPPDPVTSTTHDPAAAAEWFASQGLRVRKADTA